MPPRNHKNWSKTPNVEYISSECYNNNEIFQREIEEIFAKVWVPVCHMSELPNVSCYRTTQIAFQNVIVWNTGESIRAFLNKGPQSPSGKMWNKETFGEELHCEVKHGGMVWTTLNPNPTPVSYTHLTLPTTPYV